MAGTRTQSVFTYRSLYNGASYYFDIVIDQLGVTNLRNIQNSRGLIIDSATSLPKPVVDDINLAIEQVESIMSTTSAINGSVSFVAESIKSVTFTTPLSGDGYRVYTNVPDFVICRIINKTAFGFSIDLSTDYTGEVSYDVFI
jgi:hypothetical protein